MKIGVSLILLTGIAGMLFSGCSCENKTAKVVPQALITVGDSTLTLDYVVSRIPIGLSEEDSTRMFNTIVDSWLEGMLLSDVSEINVRDMERIDRMVADYRGKLVTIEYLKLKGKDSDKKVTEESIREYYKTHSDQMRLDHPVVKGIYVKMPENSSKINKVREWVFDASRSSVDKLEKQGLQEAMQYDYFADRWIDWQLIADQIPYRFYDADAFVESTKNFENTYNGSIYFLHIYSYLKSGEVMPLDFARNQIIEILSGHRQKEYEKKLIATLYNKGVKSGHIKVTGFSPVTHKMINNEKNNIKSEN